MVLNKDTFNCNEKGVRYGNEINKWFPTSCFICIFFLCFLTVSSQVVIAWHTDYRRDSWKNKTLGCDFDILLI